MKKQMIEKVIFFALLLGNSLLPTAWASVETKNTVTSDSINVSSGETKNIVNDSFNIIDTNVQDEYGIMSNNGGDLNINVDSLEIDHPSGKKRNSLHPSGPWRR